jgi:hypothetical protein
MKPHVHAGPNPAFSTRIRNGEAHTERDARRGAIAASAAQLA